MNMEGRMTLKAGIAVAILGLLTSGRAVGQGVDDEERWRYAIAPYLWGTSVDGTIGTALGEVDISANFSDLVKFTDSAGALRVEFIKKWGFFADIWFASLSNSEDTPLGKAEVSFDQAIVEAGALFAYQPDVTMYFGVRYQDLDGDISVPGVGKNSSDESWADAIVGIRYTPEFGRGWQGVLRADIGAGDSDLTWLAQVGVGYQFNRSWSGRVVYRYLDTDLEQGSFKWDVAQEGFGFGLIYQH